MLAMGEHPLGKSMYWPIYAAAERHGFTVGIHSGSSYHHALTGSGWPTYYLEDYAAQSLGFHAQLGSLICEGVFVKYPKLKVVLIESGVTWLPPCLWRLSKFWRGVRSEVPWIDRSPEEFVRDHVRLTIQPFDAPPSAARAALGQRPQALPAGALARAPGDLRLTPQARHELRALPQVGAAGLPARCLAGRRRLSGLQPRSDPRPIPRRLRHRVWHSRA